MPCSATELAAFVHFTTKFQTSCQSQIYISSFSCGTMIALQLIQLPLISAPSQAPTNLTATAGSSTSILVSWQLPPPFPRNGIITGFKLFYKKKKYPAPCPQTTNTVTISGGTTLNENITGLLKYTEYEFQVLAFTSVGDGPNSSVVLGKTGEDGKREKRHKLLLSIRHHSCFGGCSIYAV